MDPFQLTQDAILDIDAIWLYLLEKEGMETADRIVTELFKLPTTVKGSFVGPTGIAISPDGGIYESYTASATSPTSAESGGIMSISSTGHPTVVLAAKY